MKPDIPLKYQIFDDTFEKIKAFYIDSEVKLTKKEEELRRRWQLAFTILCRHRSRQQTVKILMRLGKISERSAYQDINNANKLFGDVFKTNKETERHILHEMAMENYNEAKKKHDLDNMNKAVAIMVKIKGLETEDPDLPDPAKLRPHTQVLQINFEFINSPYFQLIDPKAKHEIIKVLEKARNMLETSSITQYLNIDEIIPLPKKDNAD